MKKKLIVLAVVVAVIVGLLAYYQYVPFWASIEVPVRLLPAFFSVGMPRGGVMNM